MEERLPLAPGDQLLSLGESRVLKLASERPLGFCKRHSAWKMIRSLWDSLNGNFRLLSVVSQAAGVIDCVGGCDTACSFERSGNPTWAQEMLHRARGNSREGTPWKLILRGDLQRVLCWALKCRRCR